MFLLERREARQKVGWDVDAFFGVPKTVCDEKLFIETFAHFRNQRALGDFFVPISSLLSQ